MGHGRIVSLKMSIKKTYFKNLDKINIYVFFNTLQRPETRRELKLRAVKPRSDPAL